MTQRFRPLLAFACFSALSVTACYPTPPPAETEPTVPDSEQTTQSTVAEAPSAPIVHESSAQASQTPPPATTVPNSSNSNNPTDVARTVGATVAPKTPLPTTNALYVSTNGSDSNAGTLNAPFRTAQKALSVVKTGGAVVIRGGVYHESLKTSRSTKIQNFPGERVVFDGARVVTGFVKNGNAWALSNWTFKPQRVALGSSSNITSAAPMAGSPSQVFIDGAALREVGSVAELGSGRFFVDYDSSTLYIGSDPTGHTVEASDLEIGANINGHTGSELRGLEFRRYATPVSSIAAVRAWSNNMIVENVIADQNAYAGISNIGDDISVSNSTMTRNGALGGHSYRSNGLVWSRNVSSGNNAEGFNVSWEAGGFKMTKSRNVVIQDNWIHSNHGNGYWMDQSVDTATLRRNTISDNERSGVMLELSGRVRVIGNLLARNGRFGLYSNNSNDIDAWNNIIVDNSTDVHLLDDRTRVITNLSSSDHDSRYPIPNPNLFWEARNVRLINNVIGDYGASEPWASPAILTYDDNGDRYSYQSRGFDFSSNLYFQRQSGAATTFSTLDDAPKKKLTTTSLAQHQSLTGLDSTSRGAVGAVSPWAQGSGNGIRSNSTGGRTLPAPVAADLEVEAGTTYIGIPQSVPTLQASQ